jgi:hypothetical protein
VFLDDGLGHLQECFVGLRQEISDGRLRQSLGRHLKWLATDLSLDSCSGVRLSVIAMRKSDRILLRLTLSPNRHDCRF